MGVPPKSYNENSKPTALDNFFEAELAENGPESANDEDEPNDYVAVERLPLPTTPNIPEPVAQQAIDIINVAQRSVEIASVATDSSGPQNDDDFVFLVAPDAEIPSAGSRFKWLNKTGR